MLAALNELVDIIDATTGEAIEVAAVATRHGTTEHHLRRMFSSLAGMPVTEYVRRRRMSLAAADVSQSTGDLLTIAVRYGYGSTEAFGRAFRSVHGVGPRDARRDGGPFRSQQQLRFRLTVEGSTSMHVRLIDRPSFRLIGHSTRVPLIYEGANPHIQEHIFGIEPVEHQRLKALADTEPAGILAVTDEVEQSAEEGSELTYLHGVAVAEHTPTPDDLDLIACPAGTWAVFTTEGPHPKTLQDTWAATASEWFPSNPWRLRPGPSIVATLEHNEDNTSAKCELWLPIEPQGDAL